VVRLNDAVLREKKFLQANPGYRKGKPCLYVGLTGLDPDERFENHKRGHKSSRIVHRYGKYLMRKKFEHYNPMPYEEALQKEKDLAEELRGKGYGVWQH